jgi:hypothetical protein
MRESDNKQSSELDGLIYVSRPMCHNVVTLVEWLKLCNSWRLLLLRELSIVVRHFNCLGYAASKRKRSYCACDVCRVTPWILFVICGVHACGELPIAERLAFTCHSTVFSTKCQHRRTLRSSLLAKSHVRF